MDSYETHKLTVKYLPTETEQIKNALIRLYSILRPDLALRVRSSSTCCLKIFLLILVFIQSSGVTVDEIMKFCLNREKQDRQAKAAASKTKQSTKLPNQTMHDETTERAPHVDCLPEQVLSKAQHHGQLVQQQAIEQVETDMLQDDVIFIEEVENNPKNVATIADLFAN
jgi:hypothetical protein